jgi:hypothetical protein
MSYETNPELPQVCLTPELVLSSLIFPPAGMREHIVLEAMRAEQYQPVCSQGDSGLGTLGVGERSWLAASYLWLSLQVSFYQA